MIIYPIIWLARRLRISQRDIVENFEARFKLQKAVMFLKHKGVRPFTKYSFNLYIRGPYSPDLAKEYYRISDSMSDMQVDLQINHDVVELLNWFMEHDTTWLEVATSILSVLSGNEGIDDRGIYSVLKLSKPWITEASFQSVIGELRSKKIIG